MRTVTYGAACSLDGFIAREGGGLDWLRFTPDAQGLMQAAWDGVDTILMGRRTFDAAAASGGGDGGGAGDGGEAPRLRSYLFSRTLARSPHASVELVRDGAGDFVRDLKRRPGGRIMLMSGGDLARSLFAAGVIDEVALNVHPVLLGSGVPLFRDAGAPVDLQLVACRALAADCVSLTYRVKP